MNSGGALAVDFVADQAPVAGTITVKIDGTDPGSAVLVVVEDDGVDDDIELDADGVPTSPFGIGGVTSFTPAESANTAAGTNDTGVVGAVVKNGTSGQFWVNTNVGATADNFDVGDTDTAYNYDANDSFTVGGVAATVEEFDAALSRGDGVTISSYTRTESLSSVFVISDDSPTVTVTAAEDPDPSLNVALTITGADVTTLSLYDSFVISRAVDDGTTDDADKTYTELGTITGADYAADGYTDTTPAADDYTYRVVGVIDGDESDAAYADVTTANATPDTTASDSEIVVAANNAGFPEASNGDVWNIFFDEAVVVENGDAIRVEDADGEFSNIVLGTDASWVLSNGGRLLTVTLTADPSIDGDANGTAADNSSILEYPLNVTANVGITDAAGNLWTPVGDTDYEIDDDGTAPTLTSATETAANQITLVFSEPVFAFDGTNASIDCADLDVTQVIFNDGATDWNPTACTGLGTDTVVLTFDAGAGIVDDVASDGSLAYTDDDTSALDSGDIIDLANNQHADVTAAGTTP